MTVHQNKSLIWVSGLYIYFYIDHFSSCPLATWKLTDVFHTKAVFKKSLFSQIIRKHTMFDKQSVLYFINFVSNESKSGSRSTKKVSICFLFNLTAFQKPVVLKSSYFPLNYIYIYQRTAL